MNNIWIAKAKTESGDEYVFAFRNKPCKNEIIEMIWESEGQCEPLDWYKETTDINIIETKVL